MFSGQGQEGGEGGEDGGDDEDSGPIEEADTAKP